MIFEVYTISKPIMIGVSIGKPSSFVTAKVAEAKEQYLPHWMPEFVGLEQAIKIQTNKWMILWHWNQQKMAYREVSQHLSRVISSTLSSESLTLASEGVGINRGFLRQKTKASRKSYERRSSHSSKSHRCLAYPAGTKDEKGKEGSYEGWSINGRSMPINRRSKMRTHLRLVTCQPIQGWR